MESKTSLYKKLLKGANTVNMDKLVAELLTLKDKVERLQKEVAVLKGEI